MQNLAYKAYGEIQQRTASDRQIEAALFREINSALALASSDGSPADRADAVNRNQQLWSTLAADLMSPNNSLPDALRQSLLSLSEFVRRYSLTVLEGEGAIADLVEINASILAGLEQSGSGPLSEQAA